MTPLAPSTASSTFLEVGTCNLQCAHTKTAMLYLSKTAYIQATFRFHTFVYLIRTGGTDSVTDSHKQLQLQGPA